MCHLFTAVYRYDDVLCPYVTWQRSFILPNNPIRPNRSYIIVTVQLVTVHYCILTDSLMVCHQMNPMYQLFGLPGTYNNISLTINKNGKVGQTEVK